MDFFLVEEEVAEGDGPDPLSGARKPVTKRKANDFILTCEVCGGQDFYEDHASNRKVCSTCFTQSQRQDDEVVDIEEAMNMAFRDQHGRFRSVKRNGTRAYRARPPLEEEFRNTPDLPSLKTCLDGMKSVLKNGVKSMAIILNMPSEIERKALETVRELWLTYLDSWMEGAQFYGTQHPTTRFCFRDYFLAGPSVQVRKYVTHLFIKSLTFNEGNRNRRTNLDRSDDICRSDVSTEYQKSELETTDNKKRKRSQILNNGDDCSASSDENGIISEEEFSALRRNYPETINMLMSLGCKTTKRIGRYALNFGHMEAALRVNPSMVMAVSMLWMAVNRSGVTSRQICHWIRSGQLPFGNAYHHLLKNSKQKDALILCKLFFTMESPPSPTAIENIAKILLVACRLKRDSSDLILHDGTSEVQKSIRTWPKVCLPVVFAHTVLEAGLRQIVLDRALALVGVYNWDSTNVDNLLLTVPAPSIDPDDVTCLEDVLAIIVIAIQLDQNWRNMKIIRFDDADSRTVPVNETEYQYLTTGESLRSYVAYLEQHILVQPSNGQDPVSAFGSSNSFLEKAYWQATASSSLHQKSNSTFRRGHRSDDNSERSFESRESKNSYNSAEKTSKDTKSTTVRPCSIVAGAGLVDADLPRKIDKGYEGYSISDRRRHSSLKKKSSRVMSNTKLSLADNFERMDRSNRDSNPYDTHDPMYDLLVQYLAYTAQIDPHNLYRRVSKFLLSSSSRIRMQI